MCIICGIDKLLREKIGAEGTVVGTVEPITLEYYQAYKAKRKKLEEEARAKAAELQKQMDEFTAKIDSHITLLHTEAWRQITEDLQLHKGEDYRIHPKTGEVTHMPKINIENYQADNHGLH